MNLIDSIRSLIQAQLQDRDQVIDLAAEYAEECAELNSRMRQTVELLQKGLVSAATEMADTNPPILERFAELDFPELNEWFSLLLSFELDPPPPLLADLAEEIDQAYAEKDSLGDLMRMQRLLALRRAPIKTRLQVLREIVEHQPDNPLWSEDLKALEETRLKEITKEAQLAKNDKNTHLVDSLLVELNREWAISIPSQLIDSVFETKSQFEIQIARESISQINDELNQCLSEFHSEKALELRAQWQSIEPDAQLETHHPLRQGVAEVFRWLEEVEREEATERQFTTALAKLDAAFDSDTPLEEVEKLYYSVHQFDREIPEVTQSRLQNLRNKQQLNAKRKFLATITISGLAIVLAGAAIFYLITSIQYSGKKSDAINSLKTAVNAEDWKSAAEIYTSLDTKLANEPAIMELGQQALAKQKDENTRAANFESLLQQLKDAGLDPPPNSLMTQISELAVLPGEKQAVQLVKNDVDNHQQELLKKRNESFLAETKLITDQLIQIEDSSFDAANSATTLKKVNNIATALNALKNQSAGSYHGIAKVSRTMVDQLPPLEVRCQNLIGRLKEIEKQVLWLARLRSAAGSETEFSSVLREFVDANPDSPFNSDFSLVVDELGYESAWNNVHRFSKDSALTNGGKISKSKAQTLLTEFENLQSKFRSHPYFDEFTDTKMKLEAIVSEDPVRQLRSVTSVLEWYPMKNLWLLKDALGRRIYTPLEPTVKDGKTTTLYFESVPSRASDKTNKRSFENIVNVMQAPHVELVKNISNQVKDAEDAHLSLVRAISEAIKKVQSEEQPDVIVRAFLLKALFSTAVDLNPQNAKVLQEWIDFFDGAGINKFRKGEAGDWVGVSNSQAEDLRKILLDFFGKNLSDLDLDQLKSNAAAVNTIEKVKAVPEVQWVGFLLRNESGKWQFHSNTKPTEGSQLYCIVQNGTSVELTPIGQYSTSPELTLTSSRNGRPVYVLKESSR